MKTGIIVYVTGNDERNFDETEAAKHLDVNADNVEFVFSGQESCFDLWDAWRNMTAKGMKRIVCMAAEVIGSSRIRLTGRELQLCGY